MLNNDAAYDRAASVYDNATPPDALDEAREGIAEQERGRCGDDSEFCGQPDCPHCGQLNEEEK